MTATQIKDLLNNMSKKTGVSVQILQRHFMIERLLERTCIGVKDALGQMKETWNL